MSDLSENKGFAYQFNNLIFSNQKWKESDNKRDFSPDFQNFNSSPKTKLKEQPKESSKLERKVKL